MLIQPQENLQPEFHEHLKVILLGTGSPRAFYGRAKPGVAVLAGNKTFLVDCGGGVVDQLIKAGVMPQRISDVLFTHHHYDHNGGFFRCLYYKLEDAYYPGACIRRTLNAYACIRT